MHACCSACKLASRNEIALLYGTLKASTRFSCLAHKHIEVAQEFVERLHNSSRRFVPILDPGIPVLPGYKPYEEGIERDIFIRDVTGQPYIGEVG